jgi:hypothetical protein
VPSVDTEEGTGPQVASAQRVVLEVSLERTSDGHLVYALSEIDTAASNRLAWIVTRLDGGMTALQSLVTSKR